MAPSREEEGMSKPRKLSEDALEHLRRARRMLGVPDSQLEQDERKAKREFDNSNFEFPELQSA